MGTAAARELFEYPTTNLGTIEGGDSVDSVLPSATVRLDIQPTAGIQTVEFGLGTDTARAVDEYTTVGSLPTHSSTRRSRAFSTPTLGKPSD